jgi:hypothetical protein
MFHVKHCIFNFILILIGYILSFTLTLLSINTIFLLAS